MNFMIFNIGEKLKKIYLNSQGRNYFSNNTNETILDYTKFKDNITYEVNEVLNKRKICYEILTKDKNINNDIIKNELEVDSVIIQYLSETEKFLHAITPNIIGPTEDEYYK
jgi:hypothetical protein